MPKVGEVERGHQIGYKSNDPYIWHACLGCGKQRWVQIKKGEPSSARCYLCSNTTEAAREVRRLATWKGGRHIQAGYMVVRLYPDDFYYSMCFPSKPYVLEHRLVMAQHLGRCLHSWEVVHHRNGDRLDNRIKNLELSGTTGEHIREHSRGYKAGFLKGYNDGLKSLKEKYGQEIELI